MFRGELFLTSREHRVNKKRIFGQIQTKLILFHIIHPFTYQDTDIYTLTCFGVLDLVVFCSHDLTWPVNYSRLVGTSHDLGPQKVASWKENSPLFQEHPGWFIYRNLARIRHPNNLIEKIPPDPS